MGDNYKRSELETRANSACRHIMSGITKNLSLFDRVRRASVHHVGPDSGHARKFRTAVKVEYDTKGFDSKDKSDLFKFGNAVKNSANPTLKAMGFSDIDISCDYEKGHLVLCFAYTGDFTYSEAAELIGEGFELNLFKHKQAQPYQMVKREYTEEDPKQEIERPTRAELLKRFYAACDVIIASVNKNKSMFDRINHVSKDHLAPKSGHSRYFNAAVCIKYDIQGFDSDDRADLSKFISAVKGECNPKLNKMGFEDIDVNGSHGRGHLSFGLTLEDECYFKESAELLGEGLWPKTLTVSHIKQQLNDRFNPKEKFDCTRDEIVKEYTDALNLLQSAVKKHKAKFNAITKVSHELNIPKSGFTNQLSVDVIVAHSLDDDPTEKEEAQFNDFIDAIKQECNPKLKNSGFKPVKVYDGFDEDNEFNREIQFSVELEKHVKFGGDGVKSESVDELITEDADKQQGQYANFTKDQVKEMFGRAVNIVQLSVKKASSTVKSAEYKSSSKHLTIPGAIGMDYDVKAYVTVKHGDWTEKDGELSQFFNEIKDNFNRTIQGFRLKLEGDSNSETTIVIDYYRRFKYGATIKDDMGSMNDESLYDLLDEGFSLKKLNPFRQKEINCSKAQVVSEHKKALAILSAAANKVKNDPNHAEAKLRAYRESSKFPEAGNSNDVWVGVKLYHKEPDHRDDESVENMIQAIKSQCGPALKTLGFSLHVDGDFDSTTEIFVRRNVKAIYQK